MTPDEMERTIQFVVSQQAQFVSDLQSMRQEADRRHGQVMEGIVGLTSVVGHSSRRERHTRTSTGSPSASTDSPSAWTGSPKGMKPSPQAQQETEARLQTLMDIVDKYFRDRNNGRPH